MQALVSRCWRADWPFVHFHPGDLDWWTVIALGKSPGLEERIRLWFGGEPDESELVGYGWFGPPSELDFTIDPDHRGRPSLLRELVAWLDDRQAALGGGGPGRLGGLDMDAVAPTDPMALQSATIYSVEADLVTHGQLRSLGFQPVIDEARAFNHFTRELDGREPQPSIPGGYELRTIETEDDIAGRVACGIAAFPGSTNTVEKYRFCRSTPLYRPSLDTVIVAPDGSVAAFALGWFDGLSGSVELEPVGVRPDHWRRGLASAACLTTLRAARALGARQALVGSDVSNPPANALYASLGFTIATRVVPYRRAAS